MMSTFFADTLEFLLNQALQLNPANLVALEQLNGKVMRVELIGTDINLFFLPESQHLSVLSDYDGEVDAIIAGAPFTLLRLLTQKEIVLANESDITIHGKIGVVQQLSDILKALNIDWEEQASKFVGDVAVYKMGFWLRKGTDYTQNRFTTLQNNTSEYLQEEVRYLPTKYEINHFLNNVDTLRNDTERLTQRIARLEKKLNT